MSIKKISLDIQSINDITNVVYINLESRIDRKIHIESQLTALGFSSYTRFNAIKNNNGAIGCTMSHLNCLIDAENKGLSHLLICEDDTTFLNPYLLKTQLNAFLQKTHSWDVILLAGNNQIPFKHIDETCIKVSKCQTTTCYLVKSHYFKILIKNIKESLHLLIQHPDNKCYYAIDRYWFKLQKKDNWYLVIPLTVIQQESYSDIEKRVVNYSKLMTNIDKSI